MQTAKKRFANPVLTPIQIREIALAALVDTRTLESALAGKGRLQHLTRERITRALAARGLLSLLPSPQGEP